MEVDLRRLLGSPAAGANRYRRVALSDRLHTKLGLTHGVDHVQEAPGALFLERALERGLREIRSDGWATSATELTGFGEPLFRAKQQGAENAIYDRDGVLLQLHVWQGHVAASAAATDAAALDEVFRMLHEQFPPPDPSSAHEVPVTFWTYGPHGPQPAWRSIGVPGWEEIGENYSTPTRAGLEPIMLDFKPAHGGQLILWHGTAGTGKTFALRALAWEWRDWCQFHYIVDPDSFFGQHADYLMSVLMQPAFPVMVSTGGWVSHMGTSSFGFTDDDGEDAADERQWRVLVLEDTGELLTADARTVIGQGLSRFLNVVDGLIGQGLRVLVLVTTNEEIRKLHPAVARPGRCAANIEFVPLAQHEASRWLDRHGLDSRASGSRTLASLYAELEGRDPADEVLVGFGG